MSEETLFHEALAKPPAERAAFLDEACAGQPELRAAVEALLAAHEQSGSFLDQPAEAGLGETVDSDPALIATTDYQPHAEPGVVIADRYVLQKKIGEGGMGEVWVTKQTEPVKRKVALKLIKAGMDSKAVLSRFEQERQALAMMDHPNIARVLDGGMTGESSRHAPHAVAADGTWSLPATFGQPFFVMELVNGLPLTKFCDEAKLSVRERLELFVPICQAVQHAHQKGIVHRDLKPANILVTLIDGKPIPKVIDFGVAKAIGGKLTDESMSTQFGAVVGTLEYMSPEQAGFSGVDVDTRADVYSLGVILYELLTGLKPHDAKRLRQVALAEKIRIIQDEEPSKPSTRLSTDEPLPSLAAVRQTQPKKLTALLRGELDWIVMKCLEKQRDRRYETASALARDVLRYLADETVEARPPSFGYRAGKFLRRNKGPVAAVAAILVLLIAGIAGTSLALWRAMAAENAMAAQKARAELSEADATKQRNDALVAKKNADDQAAIAKAVNEFFHEDVLAAAGPEAEPNRDLKLRTVLERASKRIDGKLKDQPLVEAAIRHTIGVAFTELAEYGQAQRQLERSLQLRRIHLKRDDPQLQVILNNLAALHFKQQEPGKALPLLEEALASRRRTHGDDDSATRKLQSNLAHLYHAQGRRAEARRLLVPLVKAAGSSDGKTSPELLLAKGLLGLLCLEESKLDQAEPFLTEALEGLRRQLKEEHPHVVTAMHNVAMLYRLQKKHAKAEKLFTEVLQLRKRVEGEEHPATIVAMSELADFYLAQAKPEKADPLLIKMLEIGRRKYADAFPSVIARSLILLGECRLQQMKPVEAEKHLRGAWAIVETNQLDHWLCFQCLSLLGESLLRQKKPKEAEPLLLSGYKGIMDRKDSISPQNKGQVAESIKRLVQLYEAMGKKDEAAKWRNELKSHLSAQAYPERRP